MRLTAEARALIKQTVLSETGPNGEVSLFGSRVDDTRRGGDIDLYIQSVGELRPLQRARIKMQLEETLGIPVDVVVWQKGTTPTPFQRIAAARSIPL
jgi:predicted nucleotidyltransferase